MAVMTAQPPLPLVPHPDAVLIGAAAALVEDADGGRVFVRGELVMAWGDGDTACRRLAAVQLVAIKAARPFEVAAGFGVDPDTLRRWVQAMETSGASGLVPAKTGPKGPSALTPAVVARIRARRAAGASLRAIAAAPSRRIDEITSCLPVAGFGACAALSPTDWEPCSEPGSAGPGSGSSTSCSSSSSRPTRSVSATSSSRLLGMLLGWLSWAHVVIGTMATFLIGGIFALGLLVTRRKGRKDDSAYGPSMMLGAIVAILLPLVLRPLL